MLPACRGAALESLSSQSLHHHSICSGQLCDHLHPKCGRRYGIGGIISDVCVTANDYDPKWLERCVGYGLLLRLQRAAMMQRHRRQWRVRRHYIKSSSFALTSRPYRESPPAAEAVQVIGRNVVRLGACSGDDMKMLRRIHGVRTKRSMATSFCWAVQIPSLLDTVPESLQISTIINVNDGAAAPHPATSSSKRSWAEVSGEDVSEAVTLSGKFL
jgi:hypothetical protein